MGFVSSILDVLFPPKCVFCRKILDGGSCLCQNCIELLPYTVEGGKHEGESYTCCISALYYSGVVRKSILRYKFGGASAYAEVYGKILADCISSNLKEKYDIITWVPLSSRRRRSRGYDQSMLLALATALELEDVAVETLKKPVDIKAQSELTAKEERLENISGAFEAVNTELFEGKCVLLIDDIITTGATLSECAKALLSEGAQKVFCATLAKASR